MRLIVEIEAPNYYSMGFGMNNKQLKSDIEQQSEGLLKVVSIRKGD